jgi:hypothetical protein
VTIFSSTLNHDSLFVISALNFLLKQEWFRWSTIKFWTDCGTHFFSAQTLNFLLKEIPAELKKKTIVNFFSPQHGKNICDSHFSLISKWLKEAQNRIDVSSVETLINFFDQKKENISSDLTFFELNFDFSDRNNQRKKILKIDKVKNYLHFFSTNKKGIFSVFGNSLSYKKDSKKLPFKELRALDKGKYKTIFPEKEKENLPKRKPGRPKGSKKKGVNSQEN